MPIPVVVDTDVGFDDLLAILYLLNRQDISIQAFTVVNGLSTVTDGANALLRLQELLGIAPIPVYLGATQADQPNTLPADYMDHVNELGWDTPQLLTPEQRPAADYLRAATDSGNPPAILALGPLSNVAAVWSIGPRPAVSVCIMGGAFNVAGDLPDSPDVEANFYVDPGAAQRVMLQGSLLTLVPLDACDCVPIDQQFIDSFGRLGPGVRPTFAYAKQIFAQIVSDGFLKAGYYAWDPLAATVLGNPGVLDQTDTTGVVVGSDGQTKESPGQNIQVGMHADARRFASYFMGSFLTPPAVSTG